MTSSNGSANKWLRRVGWLIGLWAVSVAVLAVVAYALRIIMSWAGMTA